MTHTQNKLRALFLASLMVLSVMVGTVALSGAAVANHSVDEVDRPTTDITMGEEELTLTITAEEMNHSANNAYVAAVFYTGDGEPSNQFGLDDWRNGYLLKDNWDGVGPQGDVRWSEGTDTDHPWYVSDETSIGDSPAKLEVENNQVWEITVPYKAIGAEPGDEVEYFVQRRYDSGSETKTQEAKGHGTNGSNSINHAENFVSEEVPVPDTGISIDGQNYLTIQDAVDDASDGDTIEVESGTYDENVTINTTGVMLTSTDGRESTTIDGRILVKSENVTIEGLTVTNPDGGPESHSGVTVANGIQTGPHSNADGLVVRNNAIENIGTNLSASTLSDGAGVLIFNQSDVLIEDNIISHVRGGTGDSRSAKGIHVSDSRFEIDNVTIRNNDISDVVNFNNSNDAHGILVYTDNASNIDIVNNDVSGIEGSAGDGVSIGGQVVDVEVSENTFDDMVSHRRDDGAGMSVVLWGGPASEYTINSNSLLTEVGVNSEDLSGNVSATHNYWGESGPVVEGNVDFEPFYLDVDPMSTLSTAHARGDVDNNDTAEVEVSNDTSVSVKLPSGSNVTGVSVTESTRTGASENVTDSSGDDKDAIYMDISANDDITENVTITVNRSVSTLENRSIDPDNAVLNHFNDSSDEWEELDTERDFILDGDRVLLNATSKGLSPFAITEQEVEEDDGDDDSSSSSSSSSDPEPSEPERIEDPDEIRETVDVPEGVEPTSSERNVPEVDEETGQSTVTFTEESSVNSIAFDSDDVEDEVTVTEYEGEPEGVESPSGTSVSNVQIDVPEGSQDTAATIGVRVTQERLEELDVSSDSLLVNRYTDDGWEMLSTEVLDEDDDHVYLSAETPGFSLFAVSAVSPPEAVIDITPETAQTGEDIELSAADSTAGSGEIVSYEWSLDGESFEGETVTAPLENPGEYSVDLTVRNEAGLTDTVTRSLRVGPEPEPEPADDEETADASETADDDEPTEEPAELPGFGVGVALVALLAAALLSRRRNRGNR